MSLLSFFGFGGNTLKDALRNDAIIIDVRSAAEFDRGKIPGSINIPIDRIDINSKRILDMRRPIIFCCNSGDRSRQAINMMKAKGLKNAYYGGDWERLLRTIHRLH
jgi:rhodanese-related sulfurtransferase